VIIRPYREDDSIPYFDGIEMMDSIWTIEGDEIECVICVYEMFEDVAYIAAHVNNYTRHAFSLIKTIRRFRKYLFKFGFKSIVAYAQTEKECRFLEVIGMKHKIKIDDYHVYEEVA
jgi:hypothetical protein